MKDWEPFVHKMKEITDKSRLNLSYSLMKYKRETPVPMTSEQKQGKEIKSREVNIGPKLNFRELRLQDIEEQKEISTKNTELTPSKQMVKTTDRGGITSGPSTNRNYAKTSIFIPTEDMGQRALAMSLFKVSKIFETIYTTTIEVIFQDFLSF